MLHTSQYNSQMTNIEWTVENEIQLLYAMMNHKPIGINKHFQMILIHHKLTSSLNCELSVNEIWKKLETYYDLHALDESDKLPFPNNEEDFCLPQETFASLLEDRLHSADTEEEEEEPKARAKHSARKEELKETGNSTPILKKEKVKELPEEEEEEKDTPRRLLKRARESLPKKSSPSPAVPKRRR